VRKRPVMRSCAASIGICRRRAGARAVRARRRGARSPNGTKIDDRCTGGSSEPWTAIAAFSGIDIVGDPGCA
jgi:hypothetical protein